MVKLSQTWDFNEDIRRSSSWDPLNIYLEKID